MLHWLLVSYHRASWGLWFVGWVMAVKVIFSWLGRMALGENWRLPTEQDWGELVNTYGEWHCEVLMCTSSTAAYVSLISGGSSNFNALHGGYRDGLSGEFSALGSTGFYWGSGSSDVYNFSNSFGNIRKFPGLTFNGFSCRCVKD